LFFQKVIDLQNTTKKYTAATGYQENDRLNKDGLNP